MSETNVAVDPTCLLCRLVAREEAVSFVYEDERTVALGLGDAEGAIRESHEDFRIRPRLQRFGRQRELVVEEKAATENAMHGLTRQPAPGHRVEARGDFG